MRARALLVLWFVTDLMLFTGSYALAYFLRVGWILSTDFPFSSFIRAAAIASPFWLATLVSTHTFSLTRSQEEPENAFSMLFACIVGSALFALTYFFLYGLFFSRLLLVEALLLSTVLLRTWHIVYERFFRWVLWFNPPAFPTLIVGATREARSLVTLLKERGNPLRPVAILDARGVKDKEIGGVPVVGKLDKLEETLETLHITHLIQCSNLEQTANLISACRRRGITFLLLPSVLGIVEKDKRTESLEGIAVTMVRPDRSWLGALFRP